MAVPRSMKEAEKQGREVTSVDFQKMTPSERKKWLNINGKLIRIGSAATPGKIIVCFFNRNVGAHTDCVVLPEDEVLGA
jgi:hypothetical protein